MRPFHYAFHVLACEALIDHWAKDFLKTSWPTTSGISQPIHWSALLPTYSRKERFASTIRYCRSATTIISSRPSTTRSNWRSLSVESSREVAEACPCPTRLSAYELNLTA